MGATQPPAPVLLLLAAFSRHVEALAWARHRAEQTWGPVFVESELRNFNETTYYEPTMGTELQKVLWGFERLQGAESLVNCKLLTNGWEREYASATEFPEQRPLNLDPGYLTEAKLVLATTKDRDHRLYLGDGIFAEVTLSYRQGSWSSHPWTYQDYRSAEYHQFFSRCRQYLREQKRNAMRS